MNKKKKKKKKKEKKKEMWQAMKMLRRLVRLVVSTAGIVFMFAVALRAFNDYAADLVWLIVPMTLYVFRPVANWCAYRTASLLKPRTSGQSAS